MTDGDADDVDRAVAAARRCFTGLWRGTAPERRQDYLLALANGVAANRAVLALLDCLEMGMPIAQALGAVDEAVRCIRSEERRVGNECVRTCRSRWSP